MRSTTHSTVNEANCSESALASFFTFLTSHLEESFEQARQQRPNMARTKQTARKSARGVPERPLLARKKIARKAVPTTVGIKRRKLAPGVGALKYVGETLPDARLNFRCCCHSVVAAELLCTAGRSGSTKRVQNYC